MKRFEYEVTFKYWIGDKPYMTTELFVCEPSQLRRCVFTRAVQRNFDGVRIVNNCRRETVFRSKAARDAIEKDAAQEEA